MALFNTKTKEEKEKDQIDKFMKKYHLEDLDDKDLIILKNISQDLVANGLLKAGLAISFASAHEQATVNYLSTLVEQNWMIIRQLSRIEKAIENKK